MNSSDGHLSITHTAAGFPENGLFVNASTIYCFILSSCEYIYITLKICAKLATCFSLPDHHQSHHKKDAGDIHIVPIPSFMERTPPIPAPMANIKIIPKKCKALYRDPFSFVLKYCDRLSIPLLRFPIHIVLAYPYP